MEENNSGAALNGDRIKSKVIHVDSFIKTGGKEQN